MGMKSGLTLAAVLLAASLLGAEAEAGTIVSQHFASAALGHDWTYNVCLPDSYGDGKKRYPVFYLLHGAGGDRNTWVMEGGIQETADEMMRRGDIPEAVVVMPSANSTWYVDRKENMESAIIQDLIPDVEKNFRVMTAPDA
jgi:enterochelin esterase-like enzyme